MTIARLLRPASPLYRPDRRAATPAPPAAVRVFPVIITMVLALGGFAALWLGVRTGSGLAAIDPGVVDAIAAAGPGWLVAVMAVVADAGSPLAVTLLLLAVAAALAWRAWSWRPVVVAAVGWGAVTGVDSLVKHLVARPWPPLELHAVTATGFSFPSGHATISAGVVLLVTWMIAFPGPTVDGSTAQSAPPRWTWGLVATIFVPAVGASRLVLGVHYPSDVLAGWCLAVLAVGAVALTVALSTSRRAVPRPQRGMGPSPHQHPRHPRGQPPGEEIIVTTPAADATIGIVALGPTWLDPTYLLTAMGPWVLAGACLIVFAECGLLLGFFLPGDSLLFTAGLFAASGAIAAPLWLVCLLLALSAVAGNVAGYGIGRLVGPRLLERPDSRFWRRAWVHRTRAFVDRHGNRALVLGRFVPIVRTVITAVAGVAQMPPGRFVAYSTLGGVAWAAGVPLGGYLLGGVALVRDHVELMLVLIVVVSLIPVAVEAIRARRGAAGGATYPAKEHT